MNRCSGCGQRYDDEAWKALEVTERLGARELEAIVVGWRDQDRIEVRACKACGHRIARLRRC